MIFWDVIIEWWPRSEIFIAGVNLYQHFLGDFQNGGFLKYRQNYDKFLKSFFISRNMRFTDLQPWGQKASKLPKEPFYKLRINIWVVYGTWGNLRYLRIIVYFWHNWWNFASPAQRIIQYLDRQGKNNFELGRVHHKVPSRVSRSILSFEFAKLRHHLSFTLFGHSRVLFWLSKWRILLNNVKLPPMCAPRGKIILTLANYTFKYLFRIFHEILL